MQHTSWETQHTRFPVTLMFVESMYNILLKVEAALGHRTKSSARTVGAIGFAEQYQSLEQCRHAEDYDKAGHRRANAALAGTDIRTN